MNHLYLLLSVPEEYFSPSERELMPSLILEGHLSDQVSLGHNALLFAPHSFLVSHLSYRDEQEHWQTRTNVDLPFDFTFFTQAQRQQRDQAYRRLAELIDHPFTAVDTLYPFIAVVPIEGHIQLYHHLAIGKRGSLFVAYADVSRSDTQLSTADVLALIQESYASWQIARPGFNNACWYSKWRPDVEMERKYTFSQPVDTWVLIQRLYRMICAGDLSGFIPEFNDEFQIWDFENYMFEVIGPEHEAGYISFIPQSDGLMTVKRKRFVADSEIRQETLSPHVQLRLDQVEEYARSVCQGQIRALPPFRRKRFDVNLESVQTGNVYGIFFDICRLCDDASHALYQCEVEYLRSRTMEPIHDVVKEYESVCEFTRSFLQAQGHSFAEGHYSKLSFLRDYSRFA